MLQNAKFQSMCLEAIHLLFKFRWKFIAIFPRLSEFGVIAISSASIVLVCTIWSLAFTFIFYYLFSMTPLLKCFWEYAAANRVTDNEKIMRT